MGEKGIGRGIKREDDVVRWRYPCTCEKGHKEVTLL